MISCTKRIRFEAAHRLLGYQGLCGGLHGHSYVAEITCAAPGLSASGMVIDLSRVKSIVGTWINENWDHRTLLQKGDPLVEAINVANRVPVYEFTAPPSAEILAAGLFFLAASLLRPEGALVHRVRIYETATSWADATEGSLRS